MPDDYHARYNRYSHDQLYRQLHQGSPAVLARQADAWRQAGATAAALADSVRRDLDRLALRWQGLGSDEFRNRVGLIATHARELADEAVSIGVGTDAMARALAEAQRQAEPSSATAGSDPAAVRAALLGAANIRFTPDPVLGPTLGHVPPPEQQAAAYERMVTLVAELAALYGVADRANWPAAVPEAPPGMPGTEPATAADGPATEPTGGLAGVGVSGPAMVGSGAGGAAGQIPGLQVATGPVVGSGPAGGTIPAAVLSGAGPGLAGASRAAVNTGPPAAASAGGAAVNPMAGAVPMMMGGPIAGAVIGQQAAAVDGAVVEDGADWWTGHSAAWLTPGEGGTETPEHVVDNAT